MFTLDLDQMTQQEFLDNYWQKKPVIIRQGFKNFSDPIEADEMAGLAMEEAVESRLVQKKLMVSGKLLLDLLSVLMT